VLLIGDLGVAEAAQLRRRLGEDWPAGTTNIVVDASAATWLCAELIAVLGDTARHAERTDGELVVVDPHPAVHLQLRRARIRARTTRIGASCPDHRGAPRADG
jgi:anti-anti-sigma regulatory factor